MAQQASLKNAKKIVVANWKMHGNLKQNEAMLTDFIATLSGLKHTQVVVCAPYPYLAQLQSLLPVSYTHLDVYKRQWCTRYYGNGENRFARLRAYAQQRRD